MPSRNVTLRAHGASELCPISRRTGKPSALHLHRHVHGHVIRHYSALSNDMCMLARSGMAFNGWYTAVMARDALCWGQRDELHSNSSSTLNGYKVRGFYKCERATSGLFPASVQSILRMVPIMFLPNSAASSVTVLFTCWNTARDGTGLDRCRAYPIRHSSRTCPLCKVDTLRLFLNIRRQRRHGWNDSQ
jgi:hypothetical protein